MWGCAIGLVMFLAGIVNGPQRSPLRFDEWHHEYVGVAACAVGQATHHQWIVRLGEVAALDDGTQHLYQRMNLPLIGPAALGIRSPLNIGYRATLGRIPLISELNAWLDRVLK